MTRLRNLSMVEFPWLISSHFQHHKKRVIVRSVDRLPSFRLRLVDNWFGELGLLIFLLLLIFWKVIFNLSSDVKCDDFFIILQPKNQCQFRILERKKLMMPRYWFWCSEFSAGHPLKTFTKDSIHSKFDNFTCHVDLPDVLYDKLFS